MYIPSYVKKGILLLSILPTLSLYAANNQYVAYREDMNRGGDMNRNDFNRNDMYRGGAEAHPYDRGAVQGGEAGYNRGMENGEMNSGGSQQAPIIVVPPGGNGYQQQSW